MNEGHKITLFGKSGPKHLQRGEEIQKDGERHYQMIDLDNPTAFPRLYKADTMDHLAPTSRGEIRKNKYTNRAFQKTKAKAGGF